MTKKIDESDKANATNNKEIMKKIDESDKLTLVRVPKNNHVKGFLGSILTPTRILGSILTPADALKS